MKYCCKEFGFLVASAGQKGISVVHVVAYGRRQFYLQARPLERDACEFHSGVDPVTGKTLWPEFRNKAGEMKSIGVIMHQAIRFCPQCGGDLQIVIGGDAEAFDRIVLAHRSLLDP